MKRYQFRLEAVKKMRAMLEETCRSALGLLMVEKQNLLTMIDVLNHDIHSAYKEQETFLAKGMRAGHAAFYPEAVSGKEARIKEIQLQLQQMELKIEAKRAELNQRRAELKVVEKLREKDFEAWKKSYNKDQDLKVEEMVQNWQEHRQIGESR